MQIGMSRDEKHDLVDKYKDCFGLCYAWFPTKVDEGHYVWLTDYYVYFSKHSSIKLSVTRYAKLPFFRLNGRYIYPSKCKRELKIATRAFKKSCDRHDGRF